MARRRVGVGPGVKIDSQREVRKEAMVGGVWSRMLRVFVVEGTGIWDPTTDCMREIGMSQVY